MAGRRFLVSGRVQGVGYRDFARRIALREGIRGSARNLADGRVEVLAFGAAEALVALAEALAVGPDWGRVTEIVSDDISDEDVEPNTFDIR